MGDFIGFGKFYLENGGTFSFRLKNFEQLKNEINLSRVFLATFSRRQCHDMSPKEIYPNLLNYFKYD